MVELIAKDLADTSSSGVIKVTSFEKYRKIKGSVQGAKKAAEDEYGMKIDWSVDGAGNITSGRLYRVQYEIVKI
jgi:hypothetical protein